MFLLSGATSASSLEQSAVSETLHAGCLELKEWAAALAEGRSA